MKKIFSLLALAFFATSSFAEYMVFETRGIDMSKVKERKVLFVGGYREYQKNVQKINENIVASGALGATQGLSSTSSALANGLVGQALNGAAAGLGIGLVIAGIQYWVDETAEENRFIKLELLSMNDGSSKLFQKTLVTQVGHKMKAEELSAIFNK